MKRAVALVIALAFTAQGVEAAPRARSVKSIKAVATKTIKAGKAAKGPKQARVVYGKEMRPAREIVGRREEPLTLEEDIAKQIEKLLRGPLRNGVTGLYVADARSGEPLFAVNSADPLNPASNVKMISTATALDLLGPTFKYSTRLLGREPDATGTIKGDLYLLGTWDPTLSAADMTQLAQQVAARGVKRLEGDVLVGSDPTRDGIYRAMVPVEIHAGEPGEPPTATTPAGFDLIEVAITAKTEKKPRKRHKLKFATESFVNPEGKKRLRLTISGTIGKDGQAMYPFYTRERTAVASHALRAALRAQNIAIAGDMRVVELGDFIGDTVGGGASLPIELARHDSLELQQIVARVNKWSVNWLADRVIMTAAALSRRTVPSMAVAIDAMYAWLSRHSQLSKDSVVIDTGSGLSYRTRITPEEMVKVVRAAAGFSAGSDAKLSQAWHDSLSIAGTDGTLRSRFKLTDIRGHVRGKTGTLRTVIAISGLLELDPTRPLAFSIVTNGNRPLKKVFVRKAHEQLIGLLAKYVTATSKPTALPTATPLQLGIPTTGPLPTLSEDTTDETDADIAEPQPDPLLDVETLGRSSPPTE